MTMHKAASTLLALTTAVGLTGCGLASRIDARRNYEASTAAYRACVTTNPPQACEGKRLAMEADERAFNAITAPASRGVGTANINVQSR